MSLKIKSENGNLMKLKSRIFIPSKSSHVVNENKLLDQSVDNLNIITLEQATKINKNIHLIYVNFSNVNTKNYASFKFEFNYEPLLNTCISKVSNDASFEWSAFGINGVLSIERILAKMNINNYYIKAFNNDGLCIYFWTRCGYRPVLNENHKILGIQTNNSFTYFVKSPVIDN